MSPGRVRELGWMIVIEGIGYDWRMEGLKNSI